MPQLQSTPGLQFSFPCDPLRIRDARYRPLVSDFGKARVELEAKRPPARQGTRLNLGFGVSIQMDGLDHKAPRKKPCLLIFELSAYDWKATYCRFHELASRLYRSDSGWRIVGWKCSAGRRRVPAYPPSRFVCDELHRFPCCSASKICGLSGQSEIMQFSDCDCSPFCNIICHDISFGISPSFAKRSDHVGGSLNMLITSYHGPAQAPNP